MSPDHRIARYRRWYRVLLYFYPQSYHERFAESMEQTFSDLCRERIAAGKGLLGFVLWMFLETSAGIVRDHLRVNLMQNTNALRIAIGTACILLVPLLARAPWSPFDFVFAFAVIFGAGLTFDLLAKKGGSLAYRVAVGIACITGFLVVWINAAVGIIGDEELANAMYLGVLAVGFAGAFLANFQPRGMARAMVAAAIVQALVPMIALTWVPEERFTPGILPVMGLNAVFVALWLASALLFRYAAVPLPKLQT